MNFLKLILIDAIFDALYFPFWWYSRGLVLAFKWTFGEIRGVMDFLGVHIWIANLFKPMFGQTDWQGKIISFLMRVFQIVFRSLALFGFSAFYLILFVVYLILPIVIVYFIILHLGALAK